MVTRPPLGARVRVRGNTGIVNVAGRVGHVVQHHEDGVAFVVELVIGQRIVCDPSNVDVAAEHPAPYVPTTDAQPARMRGAL